MLLGEQKLLCTRVDVQASAQVLGCFRQPVCPLVLRGHTGGSSFIKATPEASPHRSAVGPGNTRTPKLIIFLSPPCLPYPHQKKREKHRALWRSVTFLERVLMLHVSLQPWSHTKLPPMLDDNIWAIFSKKSYRFKTSSDSFHMLLLHLSAVQPTGMC